MAGSSRINSPLTLEPIAGPPLGPVLVPADRPSLVGRVAEADIRLPDETASVSRRHALITPRGGIWLIADLDSKHGTLLNGTKLKPHSPAALRDGDTLVVGPWVFRVLSGLGRASTVLSTIAEGPSAAQIQRHAPAELPRRAQEQLERLIEAAAAATGAATEGGLAAIVVDAALAGTAFPRAALLRRTGQEAQVEVMAHRSKIDQPASTIKVSRSLLAAASDSAKTGQVVSIASGPVANYAQSMIDLRIEAALCAPVSLNDAVVAFLYLDARAGDAPVPQAELPNAAAFCRGLARICGLALANLKRGVLEKDQRELEEDLSAAHAVQELLLPPRTGSIGPLRYARHFEPGRFLAGDLFDVIDLPDGRTAVFLGDVTGHGAAAAMVMAASQTRLRIALSRTADVPSALAELNRFVAGFSARRPGSSGPTMFMSLWCGIIDPSTRTISFIDAGHGHWLVRRGADPARPARGPDFEGTLPLGVDADVEFKPESVRMEPGDRLILYSDGLVEQPSAAGDRFGFARLLDAVRGTGDVDADVGTLVAELRRFAGLSGAPNAGLSDDVTIASLELH
jgi:serine phosphatase RsbU (regulator of sigma subunit)